MPVKIDVEDSSEFLPTVSMSVEGQDYPEGSRTVVRAWGDGPSADVERCCEAQVLFAAQLVVSAPALALLLDTIKQRHANGDSTLVFASELRDLGLDDALVELALREGV